MRGFTGLRVLALESPRAADLAKLISPYGGEPVVAPAMREVPLDSNTEALSFAEALLAGQFDMVIFLTGVGARAVLSVAETKHPREALIAALRRVKVEIPVATFGLRRAPSEVHARYSVQEP